MMWIWARHGNTFGPGDAVVYAGKRNDLSLVAHGIEQAHRLADAWLAFGMRPSVICCGKLLRLRQTAEIVCTRLKWPHARLLVDSRLDELDYGDWTGQSRDDVASRFGEASVLAWEQYSIWPAHAGWASHAQVAQSELLTLVADVRQTYAGQGPVLAISSNGRLRYALGEVPGAFAAHNRAHRLKVSTGHVGAVWRDGDAAEVVYWNVPPAVGLGRAAQWQASHLG